MTIQQQSTCFVRFHDRVFGKHFTLSSLKQKFSAVKVAMLA